MKILTISNLYPPDFMGGYELACSQAVEALRSRGHEVQVLTSVPRQPVPAQPDVHRLLQFHNIYDNDWLSKLAPLERRLCEISSRIINAHNIHILIDFLQLYQPDVVYLYNILGLGGPRAARLPSADGIPLAVGTHGRSSSPVMLSG